MGKLDIFQAAVPQKGTRGRKSIVDEISEAWAKLGKKRQAEIGFVAKAYESLASAEHAKRMLEKRGFKGETCVIIPELLRNAKEDETAQKALEKLEKLGVSGKFLLLASPAEAENPA